MRCGARANGRADESILRPHSQDQTTASADDSAGRGWPLLSPVEQVGEHRDLRLDFLRAVCMIRTVDWSAPLVADLNVALNEALVCGLAYDAVVGEARLYVEVMALPARGPIDPDQRRVVVMAGVTTIEVRYSANSGKPRPLLPLSSLEDVDDLLARAEWADAMYGWSFVDVPEPRPEYWREPSLLVGPGPGRSGHTLDWFVEHGPLNTPTGGPALLEGTFYFTGDFWMERADGAMVSAENFAEDGIRWWDAFNNGDDRVSSAAQQHAGEVTPHWRPSDGRGALGRSPGLRPSRARVTQSPVGYNQCQPRAGSGTPLCQDAAREGGSRLAFGGSGK